MKFYCGDLPNTCYEEIINFMNFSSVEAFVELLKRAMVKQSFLTPVPKHFRVTLIKKAKF